ncbi:hypothetical protein BHE74_00033384 [Ensete ventricosum]|nr:hypothetical protein BHE74_00033384 [Ensete ventricosum]
MGRQGLHRARCCCWAASLSEILGSRSWKPVPSPEISVSGQRRLLGSRSASNVWDVDVAWKRRRGLGELNGYNDWLMSEHLDQ